jgi:hypothetical protein
VFLLDAVQNVEIRNTRGVADTILPKVDHRTIDLG